MQGCICPHPPLLIPEIGGGSLEKVDATVQAMTAVAVAMGKETVLQEGVASARDID